MDRYIVVKVKGDISGAAFRKVRHAIHAIAEECDLDVADVPVTSENRARSVLGDVEHVFDHAQRLTSRRVG